MLKTSRRVDRLAIATFEAAQRDGEPVSMELARRVVAELVEPEAPVEAVYRTARGWERAAAAARRRARA